uniref:Uncharacterized protein n=1 Tax=Macrostomum lignano TaxID=282301 RepID=A0A1I8FR85_9PLAT
MAVLCRAASTLPIDFDLRGGRGGPRGGFRGGYGDGFGGGPPAAIRGLHGDRGLPGPRVRHGCRCTRPSPAPMLTVASVAAARCAGLPITTRHDQQLSRRLRWWPPGSGRIAPVYFHTRRRRISRQSRAAAGGEAEAAPIGEGTAEGERRPAAVDSNNEKSNRKNDGKTGEDVGEQQK